MPPALDKPAEAFLDLYGPEAWQDWKRLLAHFELGEGFSFLVLLLPGPTGANICRRQLADCLAAKGRRLEVLPCEWREDVRRLPDALFGLRVAADLGGVWMGGVIVESDPEIGQWQAAWRQGLAALNERRNPLRTRFPCPLVMVGAPWLYPLLRESAPDLWSVRTAVIRVTPAALPRTEGMIESRPIALPSDLDEAADDPDYALEQANRIRNNPDLAAIRADLLLRAGNGFYRRVRHESAEKCLRASAALYKDLAARNQDFQARLAGVLNNMGVVLSALGRREEALVATDEALRIRRQLGQARPDALLPDLAMSLINLGSELSDLGRREQALAATEEAVRVCRQLAQARPDAFLPDLAMSLHNLGSELSNLGRREEALAATDEALRIRRQLAQARPDAFLPDLAMSLHNLGSELSDLGRREEALAATDEALRIRRQLAQARPDAFLPDLAMSLNNLGNQLRNLGRREEALAAAEEAVRVYRQLAERQPDAFLPGLASSLNNLGTILDAIGRREEALRATTDAVRIRRQLAERQPDAFLPDLATSLGAQGAVLRAMGRHLDAGNSLREGIEALRPLFEKFPARFAPLMGRLCRGYLEAAKAAGQEPDRNLLASVAALSQQPEPDK